MLDVLDRGADDIDLESVREAARRLADAEDMIALGDRELADCPVGAGSPHRRSPSATRSRCSARLSRAPSRSCATPAWAVPYAVVLGSKTYTEVVETTEMGG